MYGCQPCGELGVPKLPRPHAEQRRPSRRGFGIDHRRHKSRSVDVLCVGKAGSLKPFASNSPPNPPTCKPGLNRLFPKHQNLKSGDSIAILFCDVIGHFLVSICSIHCIPVPRLPRSRNARKLENKKLRLTICLNIAFKKWTIMLVVKKNFSDRLRCFSIKFSRGAAKKAPIDNCFTMHESLV